jgi:hypothetical protein
MMLQKKSINEKSAHIDPNHSHFIFVDSAKLNEFGGEIPLRSQLEAAISKRGVLNKLNGSNKSKSANTPIVGLVLGGGRNTVKQLLESVKNKTPCVFFDVSQL